MAAKVTEEVEIEKLKNKIKELEEKAKRRKVNLALQFFKKNKIVDLLETPDKLEAFSNEIAEVIKKHQTTKQEGTNKTTTKVDELNE